jgi:tRNA (cytidine/uridine-2'-O-)-methyltransferase
MIGIALYQPDIPQNVGAMMRLCACTAVPLHIIEPCGFPYDERKIQRAGMDYIEQANTTRHASWNAFKVHAGAHRIILMTTKTDLSYYDFQFQPGDILLAGRESAGVPTEIHDAVHFRVTIPMRGSARSLNIVNATAMILGEALRQVRSASA